MPGASIKYVSTPDRHGWSIRGKDGKERFFIGEDSNDSQQGFKATTTLAVGGGTSLTKLFRTIGTLPLTNVGTLLSAIATIGGVASAGIDVGDSIIVNPKAALVAGVIIADNYIPTTNVVLVKLANIINTQVGSQPLQSCDILVVRS